MDFVVCWNSLHLYDGTENTVLPYTYQQTPSVQYDPIIFLDFTEQSSPRKHIPLQARSFPSHKSEPRRYPMFRSPRRRVRAADDGLHSPRGVLPRAEELNFLVGKTMGMPEGPHMRMESFSRHAHVSGTLC